MSEFKANRDKLVLALKDREGSECVYKEGIVMYRAQLLAVRADDEGVRFTLQELPFWSTADHTDGPLQVFVAWIDLSCPFPPVFVMAVNCGWAIFFDSESSARLDWPQIPGDSGSRTTHAGPVSDQEVRET